MAEKDDNLMAALAYPLGFITGLLVYVMYKDKGNKFVLFHAMQSSISSVVSIVLMIPVCIVVFLLSLTGIGCIISLIVLVVVAIIGIAFLAFMMYQAYGGKKFKLPLIGDMAEKYAG